MSITCEYSPWISRNICHKAYFYIVKYYGIMNLISWCLGYLQTEGNVMDAQLEIMLKIKHLKVQEQNCIRPLVS
jgi:hypothetical protein